ncbi:MAG: ABC transporter ATP-binding protein [Thermomicrobiales bacterium]|nr:ABC transporter ATP-binding protein [Thermomicrobiales bacterium]
MFTHREGDDIALTIQGLGKRYPNDVWGIRHATAAFSKGRTVAVLGPNGAGKSTLIHMLAGAIQQTEGAITIADPNLRIGWSSQRTTIDWYLNTRQNIELGGRLYGLDRTTIRNRATELLARFHLSDLAETDVSMLSGGQQQRVQVARTLMSNPDIMLLDEPTAALDVESSADVLRLIRERTREGALALISSHDLGLLEQFCDDVLFVLNQRVMVHQSMAAFLRSVSPADEIVLSFAEPISAELEARLGHLSPHIEGDYRNRLRAALSPQISLADVLNLIDGTGMVIEASRERASLRDVYLQLTAKENLRCNH